MNKRQEIINWLKQHNSEIDPYKHDGSYELVQKAVELYKSQNLKDYDTNDLDLILNLTVINMNSETIKRYICSSNLSNSNKKNTNIVI